MNERLIVRARVLGLLLALLLIGGGAGRAVAAEWPRDQRYVLVDRPHLSFYPPPSAVAEGADGALLVLMYWPVIRRSPGSIMEWPRTRLVRIAPDGRRSFVRPFGELEPGSSDMRINVDDEILPLPDGSILFSRFNAIDRRRPDGSIVRFAGTGRYSEDSSGDGGPATAADIGLIRGLSRLADGSIVFADRSRIRRVAPDGTITTIAGSGENGFGGDGGPATAARLSPSDVLANEDGGFLIADTFSNRVRRVSPTGVISTEITNLKGPQYLDRLPDGTLLVGESHRIRQVSPSGTIQTVFHVPEGSANRLGDFAGRHGETIEALGVTQEGGIAVIVSGLGLRAYYLAPSHTQRALVALRDARTSQRRVKVTVNATTRGSLQLQVRRRGRVIATATRRVGAGRQVIAAPGPFAAAYHDVRVTLRGKRGGSHHDRVRLFTSETLPTRLVSRLGDDVRACERLDRRRIDCESHDPEDEEDGRACLNTSAYRLFPSGILFTRPYGPRCHHRPIPFDRRPKWTAPWRAWAA